MTPEKILKAAGLMFCQLLAVSSHAGHEIGNGGGAWVCQNKDALGTIRWAQLVDLYEGRAEFGLTIPKVANRDYLEIVDTVLDQRLLPVSNVLYKAVTEELITVKSSLAPMNADLEIVDDALFRVRPAKKECVRGEVLYVQLANYTGYGKILIQKSLFEDPRFSETDKAALLIHEAVYASLRKRFGDKTSVRARRVVGLLFSTVSQNALEAEMEKFLGTGLNTMENAFEMKFVRLRAGSFMMGSPESEKGHMSCEGQHLVQLTNDYEMQTTPVTQKQYFDVMGVNPKRFMKIEDCPENFMVIKGISGSVDLCPNQPVSELSWNDAQAFLRKLNALARDGYVYRLPTEAEWEYAARAGAQTAYSFGNDAAQLPFYGWFDGNSALKTHDVALLRPNAFGLYDMHGNVWQWVQDWYAYDYGSDPKSPAINPQGPSSPRGYSGRHYKVMRGGSWWGDPERLRSAARAGRPVDDDDSGVGIRLVRTK